MKFENIQSHTINVRDGRVHFIVTVENGKRNESADDIKAAFSTRPGFMLTQEALFKILHVVRVKSVRIYELEQYCKGLNNEIKEKNSLNEKLVSECKDLNNKIKEKNSLHEELVSECKDLNNEIKEKKSLNEELVSECDNLKLMNANMTFMTNVWLYQINELVRLNLLLLKEIKIAAENVTNARKIMLNSAKLIPKKGSVKRLRR